MNNKRAIELLDKYLAGECTPEEQLLIKEAFDQMASVNELEVIPERYAAIKAQVWEEFERNRKGTERRFIRLWTRISVAAAVVFVLGIGLFFYRSPMPVNDQFKPGGNKAYLTLGNGKRIALTGAANGALAQQDGVEITKTADGQLVYRSGGQNSGVAQFNTVETPRGGQYQVVLPDGTKVWLNASSSLRYPASFAAARVRKIEMTGEAYFEVAKDRAHPFVVKMAKQEVVVLGTHFNISSYTDEPSVKTTLLEGSVKVSSLAGNAVLTPGQASSLTSAGITVAAADVESAVAWKNGLFSFKNADIRTVMTQMSRWYDVDVAYEGRLPATLFTGEIHRDENASKVLNLLTSYHVRYRIEGRKIIVSN